jgi:hypothetical protein
MQHDKHVEDRPLAATPLETGMGISIYYSARRSRELSEAEQARIRRVVDAHSARGRIDEYEQAGIGWNGEGELCLYRPPFDSSDILLEGATKLTDTTEDVFWDALQHWCRALSEIRRLLPDAAWEVHFDDHEIPWDEARQEYDPSM